MDAGRGWAPEAGVKSEIRVPEIRKKAEARNPNMWRLPKRRSTVVAGELLKNL
jgi:hypothetical protein